jgi:hypothetical protein
MRLIPSDPDIATIINRIRNGDLNLQPDFQRGEVWIPSKKRRLIDTILREWHVPPIHVVELPDGKQQEVLDGQQRLVAIRDFVNGVITVDGTIQPLDEEIVKLDGLRYEQLPENWRRLFDNFSIRLFKIVDYAIEEPGELFFRLNIPTHLTAPEQRNAFFGPARSQIKEIVRKFASWGLEEEFLGFSNSRMAFDDVIARTCCSIEAGSLMKKLTASTVTEKYRSPDGFSPAVLDSVSEAAILFGSCHTLINPSVKFNKATMYSWLCFLKSAIHCQTPSPDVIGVFISDFETGRASCKPSAKDRRDGNLSNGIMIPESRQNELFDIYNDRTTSRVADTSSVLIRHVIQCLFFLSKTKALSCGATTNDSSIEVVLKRALSELRDSNKNTYDILFQVTNDDCWRSSL